MSYAAAFVGELKKRGYDFFTGVPCSWLKGAFAILEKEASYISAVREDAALGFAAGAWMGGRKPVVLMQNSALGVVGNAVQQLHNLYQIPVLLVVSWRGYKGADADAPEHGASGAVTEGFLKVLGIEYEVLDPEKVAAQFQTLDAGRRPTALLVPGGILE